MDMKRNSSQRGQVIGVEDGLRSAVMKCYECEMRILWVEAEADREL